MHNAMLWLKRFPWLVWFVARYLVRDDCITINLDRARQLFDVLVTDVEVRVIDEVLLNRVLQPPWSKDRIQFYLVVDHTPNTLRYDKRRDGMVEVRDGEREVWVFTPILDRSFIPHARQHLEAYYQLPSGKQISTVGEYLWARGRARRYEDNKVVGRREVFAEFCGITQGLILELRESGGKTFLTIYLDKGFGWKDYFDRMITANTQKKPGYLVRAS